MTLDDVKEYCNKRCLVIVTGELYEEMMRRYGQAHRWIPCSERMPGKNESYAVLCCDNRGSQLIAHPFTDDASDTGYSAESEECYMYNCVAWMPLPEPYRAERKEE